MLSRRVEGALAMRWTHCTSQRSLLQNTLFVAIHITQLIFVGDGKSDGMWGGAGVACSLRREEDMWVSADGTPVPERLVRRGGCPADALFREERAASLSPSWTALKD
jgi:hypothetical protein